MAYRIDRLFAFVILGERGEEIAAETLAGIEVPLVGDRQGELRLYRKWAQQLANDHDRNVQLVFFEQRNDVATIRPVQRRAARAVSVPRERRARRHA